MSDDTTEVEDMLRGFKPASPDPGVRGRIVRQTDARSRWTLAQGIAALLLVGLNLLQMGTSAAPAVRSPRISQSRMHQLASDIERLALPISKDETYAMAQRLSAGASLVPSPLVHGDPSINMNPGAMP